MASRYGIETDNWRYADNSPVTSGRGRQANMLNAGLAAYQAVRGFQGDQADSEAADAAKAAQQEQYRSTDTTPIARENYTQDIDEASGAGLGYRLKPEAAAAVESYGRGEDSVPNGGVVDPTYKQQYGLGASPTTFRDTQYTPAEKRTAGLQARADFYAGDSRIGSADKAEKYSGMLEEAQDRAYTRSLRPLQTRSLELGVRKIEQDVDSGARAAAAATRVENADPLIAEKLTRLMTLEPGSQEHTALQSEVMGDSIKAYGTAKGAEVVKNNMVLAEANYTAKTRRTERDIVDASGSVEDTIRWYDKNYKDGFKARVVPGPKGTSVIERFDPDNPSAPGTRLIEFGNWNKSSEGMPSGRSQVLGKLEALAKETFKLDYQHVNDLAKVKATGDEHVRYARAITDGRAALASGKPNKDQPIGMTDTGEIIVSDGKGGYNTKPIMINGKPATPEQINTFKKLNASTGLADSDPTVEIETEKDGKKMKMKVPLSIADPAQFRAFDVARRSKADKPGGAMAAYTPDQPGKEEKPRVGLPTRAQNNPDVSNYGALTSWDTINRGLGSRDPGAMNYIENRLRSPYGGSSVPVETLEQAAAAGSALAFEELGLRRQRREGP